MSETVTHNFDRWIDFYRDNGAPDDMDRWFQGSARGIPRSVVPPAGNRQADPGQRRNRHRWPSLADHHRRRAQPRACLSLVSGHERADFRRSDSAAYQLQYQSLVHRTRRRSTTPLFREFRQIPSPAGRRAGPAVPTTIRSGGFTAGSTICGRIIRRGWMPRSTSAGTRGPPRTLYRRCSTGRSGCSSSVLPSAKPWPISTISSVTACWSAGGDGDGIIRYRRAA